MYASLLAISCAIAFPNGMSALSMPRYARSRTLTSSISMSGETAGRRDFVASTTKGIGFALAGGLLPVFSFDANAAASVDYNKVRGAIGDLIKSDPDKGPTLVRLAWHSSGTYDKMSKTGGSGGGTIRFTEELVHGGNAGLSSTAVPWMEPIKKKFPAISYADLYTLAGVVALESAGSPKIGWRAGRKDEMSPSAVTPDGRLPNADVGPKGAESSDAQHLRDIFYRMGFDDREIVALSGAHALGRCHATASGFVGPWSFTPTTFNNFYFTALKSITWSPVTKETGAYQYEDPSGKIMMLPTDLVLIQDPSFDKYVSIYAKDQKQFYSDFTAAFQKLEELGTSGLYDV